MTAKEEESNHEVITQESKEEEKPLREGQGMSVTVYFPPEAYEFWKGVSLMMGYADFSQWVVEDFNCQLSGYQDILSEKVAIGTDDESHSNSIPYGALRVQKA